MDLKAPIILEIANDSSTPDNSVQENGDVGNCMAQEDELVDCDESNKQMNALYILKTKENNFFTQKYVDHIVENTSVLVNSTVQGVKDYLKDCLDKKRI